MPHFYAECTDNIRREADLPTLFAKVNEALAATGIFRWPARSRAIWLRHRQMADGKQDHAFVHMTLKTATAAVWKAASRWGDAVCADQGTLCRADGAALPALFTMEELDPVLNYKQNNVHALFNKA
ncbi:5-carboxymethyl-2-hydroxymuconate delta-isomerase [Serratia marcescens]|uniref:5-carboxymethyl-2-hydroxymuconate delta-isomerase n=1 Tax=Serratia marcescens TaxID=615 RepID=A0A939NLJ9_SERMA|nr:5-carboxymethyl-2-hydroxymuconate delta-isomerase [Serratia marcescens]